MKFLKNYFANVLFVYYNNITERSEQERCAPEKIKKWN